MSTKQESVIMFESIPMITSTKYHILKKEGKP